MHGSEGLDDPRQHCHEFLQDETPLEEMDKGGNHAKLYQMCSMVPIRQPDDVDTSSVGGDLQVMQETGPSSGKESEYWEQLDDGAYTDVIADDDVRNTVKYASILFVSDWYRCCEGHAMRGSGLSSTSFTRNTYIEMEQTFHFAVLAATYQVTARFNCINTVYVRQAYLKGTCCLDDAPSFQCSVADVLTWFVQVAPG
jgi:hypothetical protein